MGVIPESDSGILNKLAKECRDPKEIKRLLDEHDPDRHGINSSTWTCTELRLYFQRQGITVSEETIGDA